MVFTEVCPTIAATAARQSGAVEILCFAQELLERTSGVSTTERVIRVEQGHSISGERPSRWVDVGESGDRGRGVCLPSGGLGAHRASGRSSSSGLALAGTKACNQPEHVSKKACNQPASRAGPPAISACHAVRPPVKSECQTQRAGSKQSWRDAVPNVCRENKCEVVRSTKRSTKLLN